MVSLHEEDNHVIEDKSKGKKQTLERPHVSLFLWSEMVFCLASSLVTMVRLVGRQPDQKSGFSDFLNSIFCLL